MRNISPFLAICVVWNAMILIESVQFYTIRLLPNSDLKTTILQYVNEHNLQAASIVTCVGSLKATNFRLASAGIDVSPEYRNFIDRRFEIVSLVGTAENNAKTNQSYAHLHISLADENGNVIGGHLMYGNIVYTTAEITIMENTNLLFTREYDPETGYDELVVTPRTEVSTIVFCSDEQRHYCVVVVDGCLTSSVPLCSLVPIHALSRLQYAHEYCQ